MVTEMDGLRHVFVRNCSLIKLPSNMENLIEMISFDISLNNLTEFHVDIKRWEKLVKLYLMYNNIKQYNEHAMWTHPNLVSLDLGNNVGINVPGEIRLPLLSYLQLSNNKISLDLIFGQEQFPALMSLYLNGNTLIKFPDQGLKSNLVWLGISRCRLRSLPSYLSDFSKLAYLDARDNNITTVDDDLKVLINKNAIESYFSGNEKLCKSDKSLDCEALCHKYCFSRKVANDGYCDVGCNHEVCEYDGGDCIIK
jgi:Leucine-rich repeat (LRR) protein